HPRAFSAASCLVGSMVPCVLAFNPVVRCQRGERTMPNARRYISPPGLFSTKHLGFTHVVTSSPGTTVYISGQTAWDADRKIVGGDDLRLQAQQSFRNLRTALAAAGAAPADVVFVRLYVVSYQPEHAEVLSLMLEEFFAGGPLR